MIFLIDGQVSPTLTGPGPWGLNLTVLNDDGTPVDLTAHTLDLGLRDRDGTLQLLACTPDPTLGAYGVAHLTLLGPLSEQLVPYQVQGVLDAVGSIQSVELIDQGGLVASLPSVTVTDPTGSGASVQAVLGGAQVTGYQVASGGQGYDSTPQVLLTGGSPGIQATAYAEVGGPVTSLSCTPGTYQDLPAITLSQAGTGTGFSYSFQLGLGVTRLQLLTGGLFSTTPTQVDILALGGGGSGFVARGVISGTHLVDARVIQAGEGYTSTPTFTCAATGATVTTQPTFSATLGVPEVIWDETFWSTGTGVGPIYGNFSVAPGDSLNIPGLTVSRFPDDTEYTQVRLTFDSAGGIATADLTYGAPSGTGTITITPANGTQAILDLTSGDPTVVITQPGSGIGGLDCPGIYLVGGSSDPAVGQVTALTLGISGSAYGEGAWVDIQAGLRCGTRSTTLSQGIRYWTGTAYLAGSLPVYSYDGLYVPGRQQVLGATLLSGGTGYLRDTQFTLTGSPAPDAYLPNTHIDFLFKTFSASQVTGQVAHQILRVLPGSPGYNYQAVPSVQVLGGTTLASVTALLTGRLQGLNLLAGGTNYRDPRLVLPGTARARAQLGFRSLQASPPADLTWSPLEAS